jgi:hypothetical protein
VGVNSFADVPTIRQSVGRMSRRPKGVPMINSFYEQGSPITLLGRALGSIPPGT